MIRRLPVFQAKTQSMSDTPIAQLLPLDIVKKHLRVQFNDDDDYILRLIRNAVDIANAYCGTSLIPGVRYFLPTSLDEEFRIYDEVHSIEKVTYKDVNGDIVEGDSSTISITPMGDYYKMSMPVPVDINITNPQIRVMYNAGLQLVDDFVLPGNVEQAILLMVGEFYEYREDRLWHITRASERLLSANRVYQF